MNKGLREKGILPRENFIERWPLSWALNKQREFHSQKKPLSKSYNCRRIHYFI